MSEYPAWLDGARIAPSAHNTQPWRFQPLPDGAVVVQWDAARSLPVSDLTQRDLWLGLGAAVEGARLHAARAGVSLAFIPACDDAEHTVGKLAPTDTPIDPADTTLAQFLDARQTGRTPHRKRPVPAATLAAMRAEAERFHCAFHVVTDPAPIRRLAALSRTATAAQFADTSVHDELWQWLRLDPRDPAYRRDGLTADCLNLHGATLAVARATMPPARMRRLVRIGAHHALALDTQMTVRQSAALCLLTATSTRRGTLVETGRGLLRLWLLAARDGLTTHPVSALLDCAATVGPAVAVFGAAGELPASLFRLGFCPPVARAPRLPTAELWAANDG